MNVKQLLYLILLLFIVQNSLAQDKRSYKIFQFPADQIPRIDGNTGDWNIVPDSYIIGVDQLWDDSGKHEKADPNNLDVKVKVGWVKGAGCTFFMKPMMTTGISHCRICIMISLNL